MKKTIQFLLFILSILTPAITHTMDNTHTTQTHSVCQWGDCQESFENHNSFTSHVNKHVGDSFTPGKKGHQYEPRKCKWGACNKETYSANGLRTHIRKHIGKKHQCKTCRKEYTYKGNLEKHEKTHLAHVNSNPNSFIFTCKHSNCNQSFQTGKEWAQHMREDHKTQTVPPMPQPQQAKHHTKKRKRRRKKRKREQMTQSLDDFLGLTKEYLKRTKTTPTPLSLDAQERLNKKLIQEIRQSIIDLYNVEILLQEGADPNAHANTQEIPPLTYAIRQNNLPLIQLLIRYNAKSIHNPKYMDNLEYAITNKFYELIPELIKSYTSLNDALNVAIRLQDVISIKIILKEKAISAGGTLFYAIKNNRADLAKVLLENGENPNMLHPKDKCTPLHFACYKLNTQIIKLLLNNKAQVNTQDINGDTPLHILPHAEGILLKKQFIAAKLSLYGADIYIRNKAGYTPLELAIQKNSGGILSCFELFGYPSPQEKTTKIISFLTALLNNDHAACAQLKKHMNSYIAKIRAGNINIENINQMASSIPSFLNKLSANNCCCSRFRALLQVRKNTKSPYLNYLTFKFFCIVKVINLKQISAMIQKCQHSHTYSVLGIPSTATFAEIIQAYRALARKYHPDRNQEPDAAQKMQAINNAYVELKRKFQK